MENECGEGFNKCLEGHAAFPGHIVEALPIHHPFQTRTQTEGSIWRNDPDSLGPPSGRKRTNKTDVKPGGKGPVATTKPV